MADRQPVSELSEACARNTWKVVNVFTDFAISGAKGPNSRKGLGREFDQVAVWSIDRLGRSLRDLINVLEELRQKGCEWFAWFRNLSGQKYLALDLQFGCIFVN